jgi:hypothetical protein
MIVAFTCEMCGYGGYAENGLAYEHGDAACPHCGCRSWDVAEPDSVGYLDDDREAESSPLASSPTVSFWSQLPG